MRALVRTLVALALAACGSPPGPAPSAAAPPPSPATEAVAPPSTAVAGASETSIPTDGASEDVVLAHHDDLEACATTAHGPAPTLAGSLEVRWTVSSDGTVSDATVATSTLAASGAPDGGEPARALERCILSAIGGWRYPPIGAEHTASVHHTFTIAAEEHPRLAGGFLHAPTPTVSPGLSAEIVRRVFVRHRPEVRFCYEQALVERPDLVGRVTTHFTIDATGATSAPSIDPSAWRARGAVVRGPETDAIDACLVAAIARWHFPPPDGGATVTVSYPLEFVGTPPARPGPIDAPADVGHGGFVGS